MKNIVKYPLEPSLTGDLALCADTQEVALSRARMFLHTFIGSRELNPLYGHTIQLFSSTELNEVAEVATIESGLSRYALAQSDEDFSYSYDVSLDIDNESDQISISIVVNVE